MKFLESARREGGFTPGCHVIGDGELHPRPSLSAIRCVQEIWTGKWGIRNQSCAWNVDCPEAISRTRLFLFQARHSRRFRQLAEFQELLSLQMFAPKHYDVAEVYGTHFMCGCGDGYCSRGSVQRQSIFCAFSCIIRIVEARSLMG
jgi:hypothetical protein